MRWTERQRAMLREMGVQLWAREAGASDADGGDVAVAAPLRADAERRAPAATRAAEPAPMSRPGASASPARATESAPTPGPAASASPARAVELAPADWLVVGAPFDAAEPQQEQLLDNMLRAIGASRAAPTRARRAAVFAVADPAPAGASAADQDGARAALAAAIEAVAPRCIVALGRAAAAALLGSDAPLGHWRGRCHERGALPVVVTFAPTFLLRHPAEKAKAWDDLCLAVRSAIATPADSSTLP